MKILIIALLVILIVSYLIYKIRTNFTKKEILGFFILLGVVIFLSTYFGKEQKNHLANAFKKYYLNKTSISIEKITAVQTDVTVVKSNTHIYSFDYILSKNKQEFFCEAKDIKVIQIEDEYIFENFNETCKLK